MPYNSNKLTEDAGDLKEKIPHLLFVLQYTFDYRAEKERNIMSLIFRTINLRKLRYMFTALLAVFFLVSGAAEGVAVAGELNPADYVDIPQEGGYQVDIGGTTYYYIDGQQVSREYYEEYFTPKEGAVVVTRDGVEYYYIDGAEVSEEYFNAYLNDPTLRVELPAEGLYSYSYEGTEYYAFNGEYISEEEYHDLSAREAAAQNGYTFYESEAAAWQAASEYISSLNWVDKDEGIRMVFHADTADPLADLIDPEHGCSARLKDAFLQPSRSAAWIGDGYISMAFWMVPTESHYDDFTAERYYAADAKAEEIAQMFREGTDLEKVTGVYHYLCDTIEYDNTLKKGDVYDALIDGSSVCMGYASAFQMIMEKLGIESYLCLGEDLDDGAGHAWNAVRLGDEIYYIDATFGDTSGLEDVYLLFGTNLRKDMYDLNIPDHSYYQNDYSQYAAYDENGRIIIVEELVDNLVEEETQSIPEISPQGSNPDGPVFLWEE